MRKHITLLIGLFLCSGVVRTPISAPEPAQAVTQFIRSGVTTEPIPVFVTDVSGAPAPGLTLGSFTVTVERPGATSPVAALGTLSGGTNGVYWYTPTSVETTLASSRNIIVVHAVYTTATTFGDSTAQIIAPDLTDASLLGLTGVATLANQTSNATSVTAIKAKTDLIATNGADSPNAVSAQTAAGTAATQATTAATQASGANSKLLGNVAGQSGDAYARLGVPTGASLSADIAGNLTAITGLPASVWSATGRTLSSFAFTPNVGGYVSGQEPETRVLGATAASFNSTGTIGNKINSGGNGGNSDAFAGLFSTTYSSGTWGDWFKNSIIPGIILAYKNDPVVKKFLSVGSGDYTRATPTSPLVYVGWDGTTYHLAISVDSNGNVTGRVISSP